MFDNFLFPVHLQYFSEEPAAEPPVSEPTSVEGEGVAAPQVQEPVIDESQIEQSKSFAKRLEERTQAKLQEERQKWEQEKAEEFKDYEQAKKAADYLRQRGGFEDFMSLNEAIELEMLQEQAQKESVPVEVLQRINALEQKAARADELEQQQEQREIYSQFKNALGDFVKDKEGVTADALEDYMLEHQVASFDVAYKALRAEQLEQQLATAKQDAIKEYLESKKAPKVEGSGAAGVVTDTPPKNFDEARQRALERIRAANQQQ